MTEPLALLMLGGGPNSLIGPVHRAAMERDHAFRLVGGIFSSDPARSAAFGASLGLPGAACTGPLAELLGRLRSQSQGPVAATVCSPNDTHVDACAALLEAGVHVMCDKPLATNSAGVARLAEATRRAGAVLAVSYNLSGYPMVRQARELVTQGRIGQVRQVAVEYLQGQLHRLVEAGDPGRLRWRLTPGRAGASLVLMDIGSHAQQLVEFTTGDRVAAVLADLAATVPGREVDDYAAVLLRMRGGARGMLCVTQAASGMENDVRLRVVGDRGTLEWRQSKPQHLFLSAQGEPQLRFSAGSPAAEAQSRAASHLPPGHPQGYVDAFAVLYREFRERILHRQAADAVLLPGIEDGAACVRFLEAAVASARSGTWTPLDLEGGTT